MLKLTTNSPWFCILFKIKQLKNESQGKNQLKLAKSIKIRDYSERLKIPVQISVGYWKYLGVMNEWLV